MLAAGYFCNLEKDILLPCGSTSLGYVYVTESHLAAWFRAA